MIGTEPGQWGPWFSLTRETGFEVPLFGILFDKNMMGITVGASIGKRGFTAGWWFKENRPVVTHSAAWSIGLNSIEAE